MAGSGESGLTPCLVHHDGNGIGEIQAPIAGPHRNPKALVDRDCFQNRLRKAIPLGAEHGDIRRLVGDVGVIPSCSGGEREPSPRKLGTNRFEIGMNHDIGQLVIVESSPPQFSLLHPEPQWLDKMQRRSRVGTEPNDVARIRSDLGLNEDDMHPGSLALMAARTRVSRSTGDKRAKQFVG